MFMPVQAISVSITYFSSIFFEFDYIQREILNSINYKSKGDGKWEENLPVKWAT